MTTRQTSKQAATSTNEKLDTGAAINPDRKSEPAAQRRHRRVGSKFAAPRTDRAGATEASAPKAKSHKKDLAGGKPERARSRSKGGSDRADLLTADSAEQLRAGTKRAMLIGMLDRPEGASVAAIGQRLGWLPHTVRAAITGLRKAGRDVTRSKDANERSVYRLASIETAGER